MNGTRRPHHRLQADPQIGRETEREIGIETEIEEGASELVTKGELFSSFLTA